MTTINYLAVFVAGIVSMIIGYLWYGPIFGKEWSALMGFAPEKMEEAKKKGMSTMYALNFVGALVMAYVLAHSVAVWRIADVSSAFWLVFWIWLGFIAVALLPTALWEGRPVKLYFINVSYYLVLLFVMALIFVYWK